MIVASIANRVRRSTRKAYHGGASRREPAAPKSFGAGALEHSQSFSQLCSHKPEPALSSVSTRASRQGLNSGKLHKVCEAKDLKDVIAQTANRRHLLSLNNLNLPPICLNTTVPANETQGKTKPMQMVMHMAQTLVGVGSVSRMPQAAVRSLPQGRQEAKGGSSIQCLPTFPPIFLYRSPFS